MYIGLLCHLMILANYIEDYNNIIFFSSYVSENIIVKLCQTSAYILAFSFLVNLFDAPKNLSELLDVW